MHEEIYPSRRHDGSEWLANNTDEAQLARNPMFMKACLIFVKGDWAEFCERLGFPNWNSSLRP